LSNTYELHADFTVQEVNTLGMRNNKVTGHDGAPAEALKDVGYWG